MLIKQGFYGQQQNHIFGIRGRFDQNKFFVFFEGVIVPPSKFIVNNIIFPQGGVS